MSSGGGSTFISYVTEAERDDVRDKKLAQAMSKIHQHPDEELEDKLLPGEIVIGNANKVIRYNVHDDSTRGISGSLTCTNFRLIFLTAEKASYDLIELKNRMLNELDILLNNVESIFVEYPNKRKRLVPDSKIKDGIQRLELHCKDFRVAAFNFKLTMKGEEKKVINAILYHSYPMAVTRMFAFDYLHRKDPAKVCNIPLFRCQGEWENELQRCNVPKKSWRVSVMNRKFTESQTMPAYFVVPATVKDNELTEASLQFNEGRLPMWSWTDSNGCTMTRMALLRPDTEQQYYEDKFHHAIRAADPKHRPMEYFNISKLCPSCLQLQQSYNKLKNMCMPGNEQYFWDTDRDWLASLHSSKWMQHISTALTVARNAAATLRDRNCNVIIQEANGVDVTPVVTSLVQLMLDPTARTLDGIQALIQREWVIAGHPFLDRLGHLLQPTRKKTKQLRSLTEEGEASKMAPVFLLFLDCVYQMMVQFPARFEPSVTFLTVLYDATQLTAFDTFIFNNERQRHEKLCEYQLHHQPYAMQELDKEPSCMPLPIWAWEMQYTNSDMSLFNNPLYRMRVMKDYSSYVDKSFRNVARRQMGGLRMQNRNGDIPDGVTSFCKDSQNYMHMDRSPKRSPVHQEKRRTSSKDMKADEHKKKMERDSPFPLHKIRSKASSIDRNEVTSPKKEPFKATVGGHYPKVALMPKNTLLEKQTSMTAPRDALSRFKEERMSRSKSYGENATDDDEEDKTEDEDLFVPLPDFGATKNPEGEVKVRSRFSLRRKKPKEYTTELSTEGLKTYERRLQDYTVQPTYFRVPGTVCALYPETNVSNLKFWRQCYFRWLHWSQIYGGGPASLLQQESLLYDDIHILHNKMEMLKKELKSAAPNYHATYLDRDLNSPSGMYFNHSHDIGENDTVFDTVSVSSINLLSSYYPYSPIAGLSSNSVIGTPMSNFLHGASFFDFIRNRRKHSRSPSGVSITRSLAQSIEDISSMTISGVSGSISSKSVEDLTDRSPDMRNRLQSDIPGGRKRLNDMDKIAQNPSDVPTSRIKESVSYETSL